MMKALFISASIFLISEPVLAVCSSYTTMVNTTHNILKDVVVEGVFVAEGWNLQIQMGSGTKTNAISLPEQNFTCNEIIVSAGVSDRTRAEIRSILMTALTLNYKVKLRLNYNTSSTNLDVIGVWISK